MSTRNRLVWLCILLGSGLLLAACQQCITTPSKSLLTPRVINHPQPLLALSNPNAFSDAGCPPQENGHQICEKDSPLKALGCDSVKEPSNLLGGLDPHFPIMLCLIEPSLHEQPDQINAQVFAPGQFIYRSYDLVPTYYRYVIRRDNQFQLIKTRTEFEAVYTPVESEDEALSYALAITGFSARYGLTIQSDYHYLTNELEDTYVEKTEQGYEVYLYDELECGGCRPHTTSSDSVIVTTNGKVVLRGKMPIFEDPQGNEGCIN